MPLRPSTELPRRWISDRLIRLVGVVLVAAVVVALLVPVVTVVVQSYSNASYFEFPPSSFGLRQYRTLFSSASWGEAVLRSFEIALPASVLASAISLPAVAAIYRSRLPGRYILQFAGMTSLIIPISAYAVAMYSVFVQAGLVGTYVGLVLANTALVLPLALAVIGAGMTSIPRELELAAMIAGASRARAWLGISGRLLLPSILGGTLLAFISSFDEAVLIQFLGGPGQITLPKAIFDSIRYGVDPVITAIATLLMLGTSILMLGALALRRRSA
jgi:ABC-type spermidine/putrescine transport system permease subunit II